MSVLKDGLSLIRLTLFYEVMLYGNPFVLHILFSQFHNNGENKQVYP